MLFLLPPHIDLGPSETRRKIAEHTYYKPGAGGVHTLKHAQNEAACPKSMCLGVSAGKLVWGK